MTSVRKLHKIAALLSACLLLTGCTKITEITEFFTQFFHKKAPATAQTSPIPSPTPKSSPAKATPTHSPMVKISSVALKILLVGGSEALRIASETYLGVSFDSKALLALIAPSDAEAGLPPSDRPVLMLVNKNTNAIKYWELTDKVKMIRLKHQSPGPIELKVLNQKPLRIELWIEGDLKELDATVELVSET